MRPPVFKLSPERMLIGKRQRMSLKENTTFELWHGFMQRRKEIKNSKNDQLISMQVYDSLHYFNNFNPVTPFEKWASVEVTGFDFIPAGMETYTIPKGLYVIFIYKGVPKDAAPFFQYIFQSWLPGSGYALDSRPHFEILGEKYKNNDPDSEEEVWIPVFLRE